MSRTLFHTLLPVFALCVIAAPVSAVQYAVYPGVDMVGSDMAIVDNVNEVICLQTCNTNKGFGCVGYVYAPYGAANSGTPRCYLKKDVTQKTIQIAASAQPAMFAQLGACGQVTTSSPACYSVNL